MPAYASDSYGGASALYQNEQAQRRAAAAQAYAQLMDFFQQRANRNQQGQQFNASLRQQYDLSSAADKRAALADAMNQQYRNDSLDLRRDTLAEQQRKAAIDEQRKAEVDRYNQAVIDDQNKQEQADYTRAGDLAGAANQFKRIQRDVGGMTPAPTRWYRPWLWGAGVGESAGVQPSQHGLDVRNNVAQAIQSIMAGKNSPIELDPLTQRYAPVGPAPSNIRYVPQLAAPGTEQVPPSGGGEMMIDPSTLVPGSFRAKLADMTNPMDVGRAPGDWLSTPMRDREQFSRDNTNQSFDDWYHYMDAMTNLRMKNAGASAAEAGAMKSYDSIPGGTAPLGAPLTKGSAASIPPARGRSMTDRNGRKWLYTGNADDPRTDKDPDNWSAAE